MRRFSKVCAAAILITGSTSSTSGADESACAALPPADIATALRAQPYKRGAEVPYREVIRHAAFGTDKSAHGVFVVGTNGTLIRRQLGPKTEDLEIGAETILLRRDGTQTQRPVPQKLVPFLTLLRALILETPDPSNLLPAGPLVATPAGWSVTLTPTPGQRQRLVLTGCGAELRGLDFVLSATQSRLIRFGPR